ncbi:hypothetical protein M4I33_12320 [Clostridium sp. LY3-2]|uniref:hypothetical protein n=1 Tax=Clostridium sp. LY3-2 TaxID=2942482 RepID=UPI00215248C4|nr:hypothetical protein [Clostridium sp. LY3-2]MCR6515653.1 hypothetical protein [Clostridium sp. LY3-2]
MMFLRRPKDYFYDVLDNLEVECEMITLEEDLTLERSITPNEEIDLENKVIDEEKSVWKSLDDEFADSINNI